MEVGVFCASSEGSPAAREAATRLGRGLAVRGHGLIYGGGAIGLMGHLARAAHRAGGRVTGVIPTALRVREGIAYELADEMVVTESMHDRKRVIFDRADAFIALPGGIGTLEEFTEVVTLRKLGYHDKPVVLLNVDGFYTELLAFLDTCVAAGYVGPHLADLFTVTGSTDAALDCLDPPSNPSLP